MSDLPHRTGRRRPLSLPALVPAVLVAALAGALAATGPTAAVAGEGSAAAAILERVRADASYADLSADGTLAVVESSSRLYLHNLATGTSAPLFPAARPGDGRYSQASMSSNGRFVAFESEDGGLVPGDEEFTSDLFVHDRIGGTTTRVSVDSREQRPAGGEFVNVVPQVSDDGLTVVFATDRDGLVAGDRDGGADVFVRDVAAGTTSMVNGPGFGADFAGGATISADGRYVGYDSCQTDPCTGYVRDRETGSVTTVSGPGDVGDVLVSSSGRSVAYSVYDYLANRYRPYVRDLGPGVTEPIVVGDVGAPVSLRASAVSADGRFVSLTGPGVGLPGRNRFWQCYVFDRVTDGLRLVSRSPAATGRRGDSDCAALSRDGRAVLFRSETNLLPGETGETHLADLYLRRLAAW